jgi:sec-independent protein translocase protein TatC
MSWAGTGAQPSAYDQAHQRRMTLLQHLGELRTRILRSLLWVSLAACAAYFFNGRIYDFLLLPLHTAAPGLKLNYFNATEPFIVTIRLAVTAGVVVAAPLVLAELWGFIAPALTARERRAVAPILPVVFGLFLAGVAFVYYVLLPVSIGFLIGLARPDIQPTLDQQQYFGLVTALCLTGGVLFELPAVLGLLGLLGLVTPDFLWRNVGYALVVLMTLAAIITPTGDAFNMMVLTAPLMVLYIASIGVVWAVQRGRPLADPAGL